MSLFQLLFFPLLIGLSAPLLAGPHVLSKPGQEVEVNVQAGKPAVIELALEEGDYIAGSFKMAAGVTRMTLVDAQHKPVRQLFNGQQAQDEFFFIAEPDMSLALEASAPAKASIHLQQRIAARDQQDDQRYLSPQIAAVVQLLAEKPEQGAAISERFWQTVKTSGTPLVEPLDEQRAVVTFLVRGAKRNVVLIGAPASGKHHLEPLAQSDIWYKSFIAPLDSRLTYRLAVDVPDLPASANGRWGRLLSVAKADPLNHHPWPAGESDPYRQESVLILPNAPRHDWLLANSTALKGVTTSTQFDSKILGNRREISLYRSANFPTAAGSTQASDALLMFVFDGHDYLSLVPTPQLLDAMVAAGKLPPVAAVFIGNSSTEGRDKELPNNPEFARFMAQELHPWVSQQLHVAVPPARTVLMGSSYGGLASVTVAARYPELFGNVLALSGSFWWKEPNAKVSDSPLVPRLIATTPKLPLRLFISAGLFEGANDGSPNILDNARHVRDLLTSKGYDFSYREYASGHEYLAWEIALVDGLLALFGRSE